MPADAQGADAAAIPIGSGPRPPRGLYTTVVKRAVDVIASAVLLVFLLPVMALVWLAVRLALGAPVFHREERAGLLGRPIHITKFRSMRESSGPDGRPLPDAERLGPFGRLLRRTSLDELPQLFSVVAGDMSLVGPRPLPERYVPRYSSRQAMRLLVRPGLTGWAQIHGRNAVAWSERLEYDARYVDLLRRPVAPLVDLWILVATAFQVVGQAFTGRGVAAPGSATMEEFHGASSPLPLGEAGRRPGEGAGAVPRHPRPGPLPAGEGEEFFTSSGD